MLQDPYDDYEKERKAESAYLRRLTFGFAIFVGFILLLAAGIAMGDEKKPLPACEKYTIYQSVLPDGQPIFLLDMENLRKLIGMLEGLRDGTCRLEKPKKPGTKDM